MTISSLLKGAIAIFLGESTAEHIKRKQNEIAAIAVKNGKLIAVAINEEIDAIRHTAGVSFKKIGDLVETGALSKDKAESLSRAQLAVQSALADLDVALA